MNRWRRSPITRCILGAALGAVALLPGLACSESSNDRLDELPDNAALAEGDLTPSEFADVVRIIGDGDIPDETKQAVAEGTVHYLDDIVTAAAEGSRDDFNRPDIVRFATELGHDDESVRLLIDSYTTWFRDELSPYIADPAPDAAEAGVPTRQASRVLGTLSTGINDSPSEFSGSGFQDMVIGDLVEGTATAISVEHELPEPSPGDYDDILREHFPGMDPISQLNLDGANEYLSDDPDRQW